MSIFIKKNLTIILSFFLIPSISKANNLNTEKNIILNKNENESNKENNVKVTNLKFPVRTYKKIYDDLIVGTVGVTILTFFTIFTKKNYKRFNENNNFGSNLNPNPTQPPSQSPKHDDIHEIKNDFYLLISDFDDSVSFPKKVDHLDVYCKLNFSKIINQTKKVDSISIGQDALKHCILMNMPLNDKNKLNEIFLNGKNKEFNIFMTDSKNSNNFTNVSNLSIEEEPRIFEALSKKYTLSCIKMKGILRFLFNNNELYDSGIFDLSYYGKINLNLHENKKYNSFLYDLHSLLHLIKFFTYISEKFEVFFAFVPCYNDNLNHMSINLNAVIFRLLEIHYEFAINLAIKKSIELDKSSKIFLHVPYLGYGYFSNIAFASAFNKIKNKLDGSNIVIFLYGFSFSQDISTNELPIVESLKNSVLSSDDLDKFNKIFSKDNYIYFQ